ncbi:hypothetical protein LTR60_007098, partial [Cryomyces antarcticus]
WFYNKQIAYFVVSGPETTPCPRPTRRSYLRRRFWEPCDVRLQVEHRRTFATQAPDD